VGIFPGTVTWGHSDPAQYESERSNFDAAWDNYFQDAIKTLEHFCENSSMQLEGVQSQGKLNRLWKRKTSKISLFMTSRRMPNLWCGYSFLWPMYQIS